ncbi:ABC transporter permease [Phaeodactylibacter xiamenensis]|jgi:putative ABC transport system permease protein|uniref:ABC transporter permease n=1 Tax=Phaeodactylibacter xiamenensis TaxID=1524460 RepID=UPI0024A90956|nr:ABC transporter permease [Phaeodactylibacter xiamenensis]
MIVLRIIYEAIAQAWQQLYSNRLRSLLSLLGISIGIFCIIGVLSAVDSLEDNIRGSLDKLGSDVVYVKKWPWADVSGAWWHYIKRPNPDHSDYEVINEKAKTVDLASFHVVIGFKSVRFKSNTVENAVLIGSSLEFVEMFQIDFEKGRYFSPAEYHYGSNKMVIGAVVAEELFGEIDPIGRTIKMMGRKYEVIGVIEKSGDALLNPLDFDDCLLVSYNNARGLANLKARQIFDTSVNAKAAEGVSMQQMKDEIRGILRAHHRLPPRADDDFALNELSMISSVFDSFFGILNLVGIVIGLFAMLVGIVSVANIMFVSVKERTNLIGVKKALGAKRIVILLEFLIESVVLCFIGGLAGLGLIYAIITMLSNIIDFDMYLSFGNMVLGVVVSVLVGVASGLIPAIQASRMDPVEAMRQ